MRPSSLHRRRLRAAAPVLSALIFAGLLLSAPALHAQNEPEYMKYYQEKNYAKSLELINKSLTAIYDTRAGGKAGEPSQLELMKTVESGKKLLEKTFKARRAKGNFIEPNDELFTLHLYAGRCYFNQQKYSEALNHYNQAIRFHVPRPGVDDGVFYELAQIYKAARQPEPYRRMLEQAHSLNQQKLEYSLELGMALANTNDRKKSIYHLERYLESKEKVDNPGLYLTLGNLYEDIGRYLDTVKYYRQYLKQKSDDGYVLFALGYLAYKRIGNFQLAHESFDKALEYLPKDDILRRSRINEYKGDMFMKDLEFDRAAQVYETTAKYQDQIVADITARIEEIKKISGDIDKIRKSVDKAELYQKDYFSKSEERGRLELKNREKGYLFGKLNAGRVRWNLAESYERLGEPAKAIEYYKKAISFDYEPSKAREKIIKLQLKINRGY